MKSYIILALAIFSSAKIFSQTGINTVNPKATLDIVGSPSVATITDGIIPPKLTGNQLRAKTYTTNQIGALVYVTSADTAPSGQTLYVTSEGLYSFGSNLTWNKVGNSARNGMLTVKNDVVGIGSAVAGTGMQTISDFSVPMKAGETIQIRANILVNTTNRLWSISLDLPNYSNGEFIAGQATWNQNSNPNDNGSNWNTWRFSPSSKGFPRNIFDSAMGSTTDNVVMVELTYKANTDKIFTISFGTDLATAGNEIVTVKAGSSMTYTII